MSEERTPYEVEEAPKVPLSTPKYTRTGQNVDDRTVYVKVLDIPTGQHSKEIIDALDLQTGETVLDSAVTNDNRLAVLIVYSSAAAVRHAPGNYNRRVAKV